VFVTFRFTLGYPINPWAKTAKDVKNKARPTEISEGEAKRIRE